MNVTLGMWTLVIGGWVLPNVAPPMGQPDMQVEEEPQPGFTTPGPVERPVLPPGYLGRDRAGGATRAPSPYQSRAGQVGRNRQAAPQATPQPLIPLPPTDPSAASESYPWGPPTANVPPEYGGLESQTAPAEPSGGYSTPGTPGSGPYLRPGATRPQYRPYSSYGRQPPRPGATPAPIRKPATHAGQLSAQKPYADYRQSRGLSPYMQLFRTDSNLGTVDNYNTMVKPRLEQQRANQQFGGAISGLQTTSRVQGTSLQQFGRDRRLQGASSQQYYMNYGRYYPALGR